MTTSTVLPPITEWVRAIDGAIGPAPRRAAGYYWSRFKTPRPPWCVANDPLLLVRKEKRRLLTTGVVTMAYVLRYGAALSTRGPVHGVADVLYSSNPKQTVLPMALADVGRRLLDLRIEPDLNESEQQFARFLSAENQRGFGVKAPESVSNELDMAVSSLIIYRHFLPGAVLSRTLVPLLVAPSAPRVALPIPKSFWPDAMYDWWLAD